jgi:hypothetical protein
VIFIDGVLECDGHHRVGSAVKSRTTYVVYASLSIQSYTENLNGKIKERLKRGKLCPF